MQLAPRRVATIDLKSKRIKLESLEGETGRYHVIQPLSV